MSDELLKLNRLSPAAGSRSARKRAGRGIGSGLGKTCGRGHKGQHARSGGYHKVGFEGGQMPLQRRLPKVGFVAPTNAHTQEVRLYHLGAVKGDVIDPATLADAGVIGRRVRKIKLINTGTIDRAVTVRGIQVTAGAVKAIEAAGGKVE